MSRVNAIFIPILLTVQVWLGTYSVLDVGKPSVPTLAPREQAWLQLIREAPNYKARWPHLRFTQQVSTALPFSERTPLIVFDPGDWTPAFKGFAAFHVIGEPCNAYYSPPKHAYVGPPGVDCSHSPWPLVPGESKLLDC
jgi:hypothetical protein